jgi:hypothetical protein
MTLAMFSQLRKRDKGRCRGSGAHQAVAAETARVAILRVIEINPLRVNL